MTPPLDRGTGGKVSELEGRKQGGCDVVSPLHTTDASGVLSNPSLNADTFPRKNTVINGVPRTESSDINTGLAAHSE